jgi:hypothetical protein
MPENRVTIAQIPTGQSLELFSAVCAFFGSAIDGAVIASGDGHQVSARLLAQEGQSASEVADLLRRSAGRPAPAVDPDEDDSDDLTIGHVRELPDGGVGVGIGGGELAEQWAAHLLSIFLPAFEESGADNYIEYEGFNRETGERILLTVVKPGGKRPSELRAVADAEVVRLRALLAEHGIERA